MRRVAFSSLAALAGSSSLLCSSSVAEGPTPAEAHTPLTAVSRRDAYVFASTPDGLFRAPLETKRWERLEMPPQMPPNGSFATLPGRSPLVLYVAMRRASRSIHAPPPRPDLCHGLYLSRDDGLTWELISERDDYGATLLFPGGDLFAVTGCDGVNRGQQLLRSLDMGKTWSDISGGTFAQLKGLEPDPDHPGLIRVHGTNHRGSLLLVADDQAYRWKLIQGQKPAAGRRPGGEFFERDASSDTRFYLHPATLSNYFRSDFGDRVEVHALEVIPGATHFEFAGGAPAVVPVRVVFHHDAETALARWRKAEAEGHPFPKPSPPAERFADHPGGTEFWGLRVESDREQVEKYPDQGRRMGAVRVATPRAQGAAGRPRPEAVPYQVFDLGPSRPYEREIDLGRFFDFSKPGEYRVQVLYDTGGNTSADRTVWSGGFTGPVFTVRIRE